VHRPGITVTTSLAAAVTAVALLLGACSAPAKDGAGGTSGAASAFCTKLQAFAGENPFQGISSNIDQARQQILTNVAALEAAAPPEMKASVTTLKAVFEEVATFDPKDDQLQTKVLALLVNPNVITAARDLQDYAKTTCNVSINLGGQS
jgi:hypothetical protein